MLSRLPLPNPTGSVIDKAVRIARVQTLPALRLRDLRKATSEDAVLTRVKKHLVQGWAKKPKNPELLPYFLAQADLSESDGLIIKGTGSIVVPPTLRRRALDLAHEGHPGIVRTISRAREHYWWPRLNGDVKALVTNCAACAKSDKSAKVEKAPVVPVQLPDGPWEKLGLDIAGPFATAPINERFLIVLVDYRSKWVEVAAVGDTRSGKVVAFLENVFSREGCPVEVVTDNGSQFVSQEFTSFLQEMGVRHTRAALYNPTGNSMVERVNRTLKEGLQAGQLQGLPWKQALRQVLLTYRSTPHRAIGVCPFEALKGRKMRTKMGCLPPIVSVGPAASNDRIRKYQDSYREAPKSARLEVGQWVRHRLPQTPKGMPIFSGAVAHCGCKGATYVRSL